MDYNVGDVVKRNRVFSFVVIANHAKAEDITENLVKTPPKDIKHTMGESPGSSTSPGVVQFERWFQADQLALIPHFMFLGSFHHRFLG